MSDFFSRLEGELVAAAERRSRRRAPLHLRWTRRTALVLLPVSVLIAGPAVAAVTGVLHTSTKHHAHHRPVVHGGPATQGGIVDLSDPCSGKTKEPQPSTAPPPGELVAILGVLRRPASPADALPNAMGFEMLSGVNPTAIRLAQITSGGAKLYVIPAQNIHAQAVYVDPHKRKLCHLPALKAEAGACILVSRGGGAMNCLTADQIKRGLQPEGLSGGGMRHGSQQVGGLVPDGVTRVKLVYRRNGKTIRHSFKVVQNTYGGLVRAVGATRPSVFYTDASGTHEVVRGRPGRTAKELRQQLAEVRRDRAATATPSVTPPHGRGHAVITVRVKVPIPKNSRALYVFTLRGPRPSDCQRQARRSFGAFPYRRGPRRGLISILFSPTELLGDSWCAAIYHGTVDLYPRGYRRGFPHKVFARFTFQGLR